MGRRGPVHACMLCTGGASIAVCWPSLRLACMPSPPVVRPWSRANKKIDKEIHPASTHGAEQGDSGKRGRSSSSAAAAAEGASSAGGATQQQKSSGDLLTKAVLMYPLVVLRLMGKLQEKGTGES